MLVPAYTYREELIQKFSKELYTERFFYYQGWGGCNSLPDFELRDDKYQFACLYEEEVIGYFSYYITQATDCVDSFGLYAFDDNYNLARNSLIFIKDVEKKLEHLIATHHKVSWRMVSGNPVERWYTKFCIEHGGRIVELRDVCKDTEGKYRNELIYEIINPEV